MADFMIEPPFYPIIYVRGFAFSQNEVEDTTADPYMGFNIGSMKLRQIYDGTMSKHIFESPLVRLMKDHTYQDVYFGGAEMPAEWNPPSRPIIIYRYYDSASEDFGDTGKLPITDYAIGLGKLIIKIRDRIKEIKPSEVEKFKVYLVAHSMGGLICRCFLQNQTLGESTERHDLEEARRLVDKVFTYATPHNGIDISLLGNVPSFLTMGNMNNFNRSYMRRYLDILDNEDDASNLDGKFDPRRFFNLVGTNPGDYGAVGGLSKRGVGALSDGLVRIKNATTKGEWINEEGKKVLYQSPRAFVHRSHSGQYGIVNSEEGYQNLVRFLFGDIRVDGKLNIKKLTLPDNEDIQKAYKDGTLKASFHFEATVRTRGALWELHRRRYENGSAVFRQYRELIPRANSDQEARDPHLFSLFLSELYLVKKKEDEKEKISQPSSDKKNDEDPPPSPLGFSIDIGILVPDYTIDKKFWLDEHYEQGYIYREKFNFRVTPSHGSEPWEVFCGKDSKTPNMANEKIKLTSVDGGLRFKIPIRNSGKPGIIGELIVSGYKWNDWHDTAQDAVIKIPVNPLIVDNG